MTYSCRLLINSYCVSFQLCCDTHAVNSDVINTSQYSPGGYPQIAIRKSKIWDNNWHRFVHAFRFLFSLLWFWFSFDQVAIIIQQFERQQSAMPYNRDRRSDRADSLISYKIVVAFASTVVRRSISPIYLSSDNSVLVSTTRDSWYFDLRQDQCLDISSLRHWITLSVATLIN